MQLQVTNYKITSTSWMTVFTDIFLNMSNHLMIYSVETWINFNKRYISWIYFNYSNHFNHRSNSNHSKTHWACHKFYLVHSRTLCPTRSNEGNSITLNLNNVYLLSFSLVATFDNRKTIQQFPHIGKILFHVKNLLT